jgi:hypothetical protein
MVRGSDDPASGFVMVLTGRARPVRLHYRTRERPDRWGGLVAVRALKAPPRR